MFLKEVFGLENFSENEKLLALLTSTFNWFPELTLSNLEGYISEVLVHVCEDRQSKAHETEPANIGRIGPEQVVFQDGNLLKRLDQLELTSHNHFGSAKANVGVCRGKWMYEVMLNSAGVMQVGWCTLDCTFSREEGVGDTPYSYAYDGARKKKWNNKTSRNYGDLWSTADVISCCIDCDHGLVEFYRNGHSMGVAYDTVRLGPGYAYFPAVSLSMSETVLVNFGGTPFRYTVEGYKPLENPPTEKLIKANLLTTFLHNFVEKTSQIPTESTPSAAAIEIGATSQKNSQTSRSASRDLVATHAVSHDAKVMLSANAILDHLGPLLKNEYVVVDCILKLFLKLTDVSHCHQPQRKIQTLLSLMWSLLQEHELKACLENLISALHVSYRFTSVRIGYHDQKQQLMTLLAIIQHPRTRIYLLKHVFFSGLRCFNSVKFWHFIHFRSLGDDVIDKLIHTIWWKDRYKIESENQEAKEQLSSSCKQLEQQGKEMENIQTEILKLLLISNDAEQGASSSRFIFMTRFREYMRDMSNSRSVYPHLVHHYPLAVGLCVFQRLLQVVRAGLEEDRKQAQAIASGGASSDIFVPVKMFYDESVNYHGVQRAGGLLSHLKKEYRQELHDLGCRDIGVAPELPKHRVFLDHKSKMIDAQKQTIRDQLGDNGGSRAYLELLDGLLLLYSTSACKQVVKVSLLRDAVNQYLVALEDVSKKLEACPAELSHVRQELETSRRVFTDVMEKQSRQLHYIRSILFTQEKRNDIWWLLNTVLKTVEEASESGKLFTFVPEYYMTVVVSLYAAIKSHFACDIEEPENPEYTKTTERVALFLTNHYADNRVVNAEVKDTLMRALIAFVCQKEALSALERMHEINKIGFVKKLLLPNREGIWTQSNWILVRFWMGCGFGFRHSRSTQSKSVTDVEPLHESGLTVLTEPAAPSAVFQELIAKYMHHNMEDAVKFVDSILTQLNWCFSEFIGILQEAAVTRSDSATVESRQLKLCSACFEIAVALMRVLEMLTSLVPEVFTDFARPSAELLLCRLCQSVCQILNRVTSKSGSFYKVIVMLVPGLELVGHFPIVTACAGVLVNLCVKTEGRGQERAMAAFLADSNFEPTFLDFMLQEPPVTGEGATAGPPLAGEGATSGPPLAEERATSGLPLAGEGTTSGTSVSDTPRRQRLKHKSYKEEISKEELHTIESLIESFKSKYMATNAVELDEESVCNICYAKPKSVSFRPCGHQSCRGCIAHQLMACPECFFCKVPVECVEELRDGTPL